MLQVSSGTSAVKTCRENEHGSKIYRPMNSEQSAVFGEKEIKKKSNKVR